MRLFKLILVTLLISGCAAFGARQFNQLYGDPSPQQRLTPAASSAGQHYYEQVKPILDGRCVVCHGCYDAPCQLKLSSPEGIDRGMSKQKVYSGTRLLAADPSRLYIDAQSTAEWREKGFFPALNERNQHPDANLAGSVLYQSLALKQQHPLPEGKYLPEKAFDLSLNRKNECPSVESYHAFAKDNPLAGMPYGLPGLEGEEFATLTNWIAQGASMADLPPLDSSYQDHIEQWEAFLNQDSLKAQLASRYIYEHLFLGNLYFDDLPRGEYFKLVRSSTPPGEPISVIATRRPYHDPKVDRVYYRLQRLRTSVLTKTHLPYSLSEERMQWMRALFLTPEYEVSELPGYDEKTSSNPFATFKAIPARSRYRFMLEEAQFTIMGFIKGPVCRGQVAVDVINDHFWVTFVDPDSKALPMIDGFLEQQVDNLRLPGEAGSNAGLLAHWTRYSGLNKNYLLAKKAALNEIFRKNQGLGLDLLWDGDGHNDNAALTIFRQFDSAAVVKGLVGESPKTAWVIDYPLLERIHYLLTAEFDVYGNIGHQLNTRLYMDFLRIEGEFNFLALLPHESRFSIRDYWYRDASNRVKEHLYSCEAYIEQSPTIDYQTSKPQQELYQLIQQRLDKVLNHSYALSQTDIPQAQRSALSKLQGFTGLPASLLPEMSNLLVESPDGSARLYSVLRNSAHSNITSLFRENSNRLPEEDNITVTYGVIGDYPNAFWKVTEAQLPDLVERISRLQSAQDYHALMDAYGVRRTNPDFWQHSDRVHQQYQQQQPHVAGLLDFNRLENR